MNERSKIEKYNKLFKSEKEKDKDKEKLNKAVKESIKKISNLMITVPIKNIFLNDQHSFISLVDEIIFKKSKGEDTTELENKIDVMVYKLSELTYEEVKIVDPEFWMSEGEYGEIGN